MSNEYQIGKEVYELSLKINFLENKLRDIETIIDELKEGTEKEEKDDDYLQEEEKVEPEKVVLKRRLSNIRSIPR